MMVGYCDAMAVALVRGITSAADVGPEGLEIFASQCRLDPGHILIPVHHCQYLY